MDGSGSSPRLFTHSRAHDCSLGPKDPFLVELTTLPNGGAFETTHPSMLLTARSMKEAKSDAFMAKVEANKAEGREQLQTLLALLRSHPGCGRNDLRKLARGTVIGGKETLADTIDDAIEQGLVSETEVTGRGGKKKILTLVFGGDR